MTRKEKLYEQLYELMCKFNELKGRSKPRHEMAGEISCYSVSYLETLIRDHQTSISIITHKKKVEAYWSSHADEKKIIERAIESYCDTEELLLKEFTNNLNKHLARFHFEVKGERASAYSFDIISTLEHHNIFDVVHIYYNTCYGQQPHLEFSVGSTGAMFLQSTDISEKARVEYMINAGKLFANEMETGSIATYHQNFKQQMSVVRHALNELQNKLDNPNLQEDLV